MTFDIINFLARQEQSKQLILTNSKTFLLTVSNEQNGYNLILWLIA